MRNETRPLNGDINVTPFLDVLLVLIITFMAAMDIARSAGVKVVSLPPGNAYDARRR